MRRRAEDACRRRTENDMTQAQAAGDAIPDNSDNDDHNDNDDDDDYTVCVR